MAREICGQLDISQIDDNELIAISGYGAWVGFEVEEKTYELIGHPYAYAVIKFNSPCWSTPCSGDSSNLINQSFLMISNALSNTILKSGTQNPSVSEFFGGSGEISNIICGVNIDLLKIAQENVDSLQSNEKGFQPAAIKPKACVVPMKSNVFSYGPWASNNFATTYGGAELQINNDLAPWLFGSTQLLNAAGQELANTTLVGLSYAEKGSATVVGLPMYTAGTALSSGPVLTNVSVSFGANGATTTYDFATYTPKFGQLSRAIIERYKTIAANRNEQLRFLRQNAINNNKIGRKFAGVPTATNFNTYNRGSESSKSLSDRNSLGRLLVGEIFDYQDTANSGVGQRTVVGLTTLSKSVLEMRGSGYRNKGFMSLDGLYGPVSISGGGGLPRFVEFPNYTGYPANSYLPIGAQPPFLKSDTSISATDATASDINEQSETISIHKNYLNPLSNPNSIPHHNGQSAGHCIEIAGRETSIPRSGLMTNFYRPESNGKYSSDYRFLGMRGPLVLHSWGYDTDGKPVPNAADVDSDTKNGIFTTDNLKGEFLNDWLQKPHTWPVAPVDLRLDRERGVWVSPQQPKIVVIELKDNLKPYGRAQAKLITKYTADEGEERLYSKTITDKDGYSISDDNTLVIAEDRIGLQYTPGNKAYAYYDSFTSTYIILEAANSLLVGYTEGLWYKNTFKAVQIKKVEISETESFPSFVDDGDPVMVYNMIENTGRLDSYYVIIAKINGLYIYINGGACTD